MPCKIFKFILLLYHIDLLFSQQQQKSFIFASRYLTTTIFANYKTN